MEKLKENALALSQTKEFEKKVNCREFEIEITKLASSYKMNEELEQFLETEIKNNIKVNKKYAFVLFFVYFTMCRRQNYGNILELTKDYWKCYV